MSKLDELNAKMEALKTEFKNSGKEAIEESIKEIFESHPELEAITWTQYAPYFNDGEPCTFSVNDVYYKLVSKKDESSEENTDEEDEDDDEYESWDDVPYNEKTRTPLEKKLHAFEKQLQSLQELAEVVYGPDCRVVVNRNETIIEEYSHD